MEVFKIMRSFVPCRGEMDHKKMNIYNALVEPNSNELILTKHLDHSDTHYIMLVIPIDSKVNVGCEP